MYGEGRLLIVDGLSNLSYSTQSGRDPRYIYEESPRSLSISAHPEWARL